MGNSSALPDDILYLISKEPLYLRSLFYLSIASKNFYEVFNHCLYKQVYSTSKGQMHTVALSESARMPLTGPHPASFVKSLRLSYCLLSPPFDLDGKGSKRQEDSREILLRGQANAVLNNIAAHHGVLNRLEISFPDGGLDLHEVLVVDSNQFRHLKELIIQCPLLKKECLDVFESLCRSSPSLDFLSIKWNVYKDISDSNAITRLMETIPKVCPNLKDIEMCSLKIYGRSTQSLIPFQRAVDDPSFTFPLLEKCYFDLFVDCNQFLLHHPGIKKLQCTDSTESFAPFGILPNLKYFKGHIADYTKLCAERPPPINCLVIDIPPSSYFPNAERKKRFYNELIRTKTLRKLHLSYRRIKKITSVFLSAIIEACPRLTHFICEISSTIPRGHKQLFSSILRNLPNLEHLKLVFCCLDPVSTLQIDCQIFSTHCFLKTIQIDLSDEEGHNISQKLYFVKGNDNVIISVSGLDPHRFSSLHF